MFPVRVSARDRVLAWVLAGVGLLLVVISLFVAWTRVGDSVSDEPARAWDGFHALGSVVILVAVTLSVAGWRRGGDVERAGLIVGALMGSIGLLVHWSAPAMYRVSEPHSDATIGPGVPLATAGLALLCIANVVRYHCRRRGTQPPRLRGGRRASRR